jgi:hypothetical protein
MSMRKSTVALFAALICITTAGTASAQRASVADRPGIDFGVRLGLAVPFGDIDGNMGDGLASAFSSAVPVVLEGGYRFSRAVTAGLLFQYGFGQVKDDRTTGCGNGIGCSGNITRLGVEGLYHFPVAGSFVPFLGLGLGYEWMKIVEDNGAVFGAHGFEFVTLQGGGDYRVAPQVSLGPFLSFSVARYDTVSNPAGRAFDIANPAVHEWLQIGLRGLFNL